MKHRRRVLAATAGIIIFVIAVLSYFFVFHTPTSSEEPVVIGEEELNVNEVRPRDFRVEPINSTKMKLTWQTKKLTESYVLVGTESNELTTKYYETEGGFTTDHQVEVFDLAPGQKYYFVVVSNGMEFGRYNAPLEFITEL